MTVKTHKLDGQINVRDLHNSSRHMFASLDYWLHQVLSKHLKRYGFLLQSTEELVRKWNGCQVLDGTTLVRLDVELVFMLLEGLQTVVARGGHGHLRVGVATGSNRFHVELDRLVV